MQSSKTPRKKSKSIEPVAATPAVPERASKPTNSRASKRKVEAPSAPGAMEEPAMKHHHSLVAAESATINHAANEATTSDAKPAIAVASPMQEVKAEPDLSHEMIAELAHRYWAERGFPEGSAETDWLRAEQHLKAHSAGA